MLSDEFRAFLHDAGAKLTGFADMSGVPGCAYPRAVSVALPVPRHILSEIADGPTRSYYYMYHELNNGLNRIITSGAEYLRALGYAAEPMTTDVVKQTPDHRTALPHKTAAVRAGLGWIGRNCLLVTPEYGPAVRISTLLTDAPLDCARPALEPRCGECRAWPSMDARDRPRRNSKRRKMHEQTARTDAIPHRPGLRPLRQMLRRLSIHEEIS